MIGLDAQQDRRRALWNAKCRCSGPLAHCRCIAPCETCGHLRIEHDYDYATDTGVSIGGCEVDDCLCGKFVDEDDE